MEAEKEELSKEIAALQQERDEGLLLVESEKQQVCELGRGVGSSGTALGLSPSAQRTPTQQLGVQEAARFFRGLSSHCRAGELEA